ncbi:MAG: glycosyltransferase family 4 protein [Planctomycetes bacterium]|nr:glycosyltransferase family 4 protein [Planctomycetota bacterium]
MVRAQPHLLHVFSTFVPAGPETRTVRIIEGLGHEFRHSILAMDGRTDAFALFSGRYDVKLIQSLPKAGSFATLRRLRKLFVAVQPHAVLSYNWGAFDAVFAARTLGYKHSVHHEDGFTSDEAQEFKQRRILARKFMLPGVHKVVVPSQKLHGIATTLWKLPPSKVACIPNGVALASFSAADGNPKLRAELKIPKARVVLGACGHLRPEKNPLRLLRAAARIDREIDFHVLILGDGPERAACEELARTTASLYGRVTFAGHVKDPTAHYRAMDAFCISSDTEQMPVALIEAMASSLPVVSTDVGDVRAMLPDAQADFVVPMEEHETAWPLAEKLTELLRDATRRRAMGTANRKRAEERYSFESMLRAYRDIYQSATAR